MIYGQQLYAATAEAGKKIPIFHSHLHGVAMSTFTEGKSTPMREKFPTPTP